jgi:hypothetical protein
MDFSMPQRAGRFFKNELSENFEGERTAEFTTFECVDIATGLRHSRAPFASERGALARISVTGHAGSHVSFALLARSR